MLTYLKRLFGHMRWADDRVLEMARSLDVHGEAHGRILRLLSHLVAAEQVWLGRVTGEGGHDVPIWPEWTWEVTAEAAGETGRAYARLLGDLTVEHLERTVEYRNSKGVPFHTRLGDILVHVAMHGSYHRGQIAASVRDAGGEPVNTDYITYVREVDD